MSETRAQLLDALYADILRPDWSQRFLVAFARQTRSKAAAVVAVDLKNQSMALEAFAGAEDATALAYDREYAAQNPWSSAQRVHAQKAGEVIISDTLVPLDALKKTRFWSGFLKPLNLAHAVGVLGERTTERVISLTLLRSERAGVYRDAPLALLNAVSGHWANACAIRTRLGALASSAPPALLDGVAQPLILVDANRRVLRLNAAADGLLREADPFLFVRQGTLVAHTAQNAARLDTLIAAAAHFAAIQEDAFISLTDGAGNLQAYIAAHPMTGMAPNPCVLLTIQPVAVGNRAQRSLSRALCRTYGLTPREVELSLLVASTNALDEAAASMGITLESARTRFKTICAKLGCRGRAGFVAAIHSLKNVLPPRS